VRWHRYRVRLQPETTLERALCLWVQGSRAVVPGVSMTIVGVEKARFNYDRVATWGDFPLEKGRHVPSWATYRQKTEGTPRVHPASARRQDGHREGPQQALVPYSSFIQKLLTDHLKTKGYLKRD